MNPVRGCISLCDITKGRWSNTTHFLKSEKWQEQMRDTHSDCWPCCFCVAIASKSLTVYSLGFAGSTVPLKKRRTARLLPPDHLHGPLPPIAMPNPGGHIPSAHPIACFCLPPNGLTYSPMTFFNHIQPWGVCWKNTHTPNMNCTNVALLSYICHKCLRKIFYWIDCVTRV